MQNALPSTEKLNELFLYNKEAGVLIWRKSKGRAKSGSIAGNKRKDGYLAVRIDSKLFLVHRIIWKMCSNRDPENQIDHVNCNKSDNRIENLRDVTNKQNNYNKHVCYLNNRLGVLGVCKKGKKFSSRISVDRKNIPLGVYNTKEEAYTAYVKAKAIYHHYGE